MDTGAENTQITYGLVLGGGGARGAYQIGAWKALDKMRIHIGAVAGSSIGAINGALFAQGDYQLAQKIWRTMTLRDVIRLEGDLTHRENLFDIRNLNQILFNMIRNGGLDTDPLRESLKKFISEERVRQSPVSLGIFSYEMTGRKPTRIFADEMPEGTLHEYLMASARLPVFKTVSINGQRFLDGAFYNNLPADMLADRGYRHLILIDLGGVEIVRGTGRRNLDITMIRPSSPLGGVLDLSPYMIRRNMRRGMLDTYRAFGRLTGRRYYLSVRSTARFIRKYGQDVLEGLETAAERYGIDPVRVFTPERLLSLVAARFAEDTRKYLSLRSAASGQDFLSRLAGERPRLRKLEKDYLIPAAVDILGSPAITPRARETVRRLMPAAAKAAEALLALGIRPEPE